MKTDNYNALMHIRNGDVEVSKEFKTWLGTARSLSKAVTFGNQFRAAAKTTAPKVGISVDAMQQILDTAKAKWPTQFAQEAALSSYLETHHRKDPLQPKVLVKGDDGSERLLDAPTHAAESVTRHGIRYHYVLKKASQGMKRATGKDYWASGPLVANKSVQGTSALIMGATQGVMFRDWLQKGWVWNDDKSKEVHLFANIHDAVVANPVDGMADEVAADMKNHFENVREYWKAIVGTDLGISLKADVETGECLPS